MCNFSTTESRFWCPVVSQPPSLVAWALESCMERHFIWCLGWKTRGNVDGSHTSLPTRSKIVKCIPSKAKDTDKSTAQKKLSASFRKMDLKFCLLFEPEFRVVTKIWVFERKPHRGLMLGKPEHSQHDLSRVRGTRNCAYYPTNTHTDALTPFSPLIASHPGEDPAAGVLHVQ